MSKVAVVGTGTMGKIYATLLAESRDADLVAVVGNTAEKTKALASPLGAKAYTNGDVESLLKNHGDLDGIVFAAPEWVRLPALTRLMATGKHLLIEKPLATSSKDLAEMDRVAREHVGKLSMVHSLRFSPRFSQVHKAMERREIGELRHIYARRNGCTRTVQRVLDKFPLAYWLTCHDVDLMRWYTGSEVESVYAVSRAQLKSADDYLIVHLHFQNGVDAIEEISWCSPSLSQSWPGCLFSLKGTEGCIEVSDYDMDVSTYKAGNQVMQPDTYDFYDVAGKHYGTFRSMIDQWLACVRGEARPYVTYDDGRAAVKVCALIEESLASGQKAYARN